MPNESGQWLMRGLGLDDPMCIRTLEALISYIEQVGFLPLFANEICGFSVEDRVHPRFWWTGDPVQDPWIWREIIAKSGKIAYGKFFGRKAGFISREWFPCFANYRRKGYDFDARYEDELASSRCKRIMDLFEDNRELYSFEIKQMAGFGKGGEKNFDGVIAELQMQGYIVTRDFRRRRRKKDGQEYGWPIAVYTTPEILWGYETISAAYREEPEKSLERIVDKVKREFPEGKEGQIKRMMGGERC